MEMSARAAHARQDVPFMERFIHAHEPFILRAASAHTGHTVTRSDDEFSIALLAFYEAIRGYDPESGPFGAYAKLVIGRRLTDYFRSVHRFDAEITLAPQTFDGEIDEEQPDMPVQLAVAERMAKQGEEPLGVAGEIEDANQQFTQYGFSFYDLTSCAPHAEKTRRACAVAVTVLQRSPDLLKELRRTHSLPIRALARDSGVSRKVVERHRKYIIAAVLLLEGEYPALSKYLQAVQAD